MAAAAAAADAAASAAGRADLQEAPAEDDADDLVDGLVVDGDARVLRAERDLEEVREARIDAEPSISTRGVMICDTVDR